MFKDVKVAMKNLIDYIQTSGELEKYWTEVDQQNNDARKAARKLEKERKKIEMGSDFDDSDPEAGGFAVIVEEDSWDRSSSDEYDDEYGSQDN